MRVPPTAPSKSRMALRDPATRRKFTGPRHSPYVPQNPRLRQTNQTDRPSLTSISRLHSLGRPSHPANLVPVSPHAGAPLIDARQLLPYSQISRDSRAPS